MSPWGPWDTKTQFFWLKTLPLHEKTLLVKKIWNFFHAFRGDSGIVKKTKSELTHPKVILVWQKNFWDILFFCKICVQNFVKIHAVVLEIFTCLLLTDRQTDERMSTIYGWAGETFLLFEKITSPTHYANFASLICSVRRGIKTNWKKILVKYRFIIHILCRHYSELNLSDKGKFITKEMQKNNCLLAIFVFHWKCEIINWKYYLCKTSFFCLKFV
jgi:hypothetical protein